MNLDGRKFNKIPDELKIFTEKEELFKNLIIY